MGVAHKKLPCGTTVKFVYHGKSVVTQVIDRGPYVDGSAWDLTKAASDALGFEGVDASATRSRSTTPPALEPNSRLLRPLLGLGCRV